MRPFVLLAWLLTVGLQLAGCTGEDPIRKYVVPIENTGAAGVASSGALPFDCLPPDGWTEKAAGAMQLAAYAAGAEPDAVEITVSVAGGDLAANVNRWRGQIKLPPLAADELLKSLDPLQVSGRDSLMAELVGEEESILGVVAPGDSGQSWFIKARGPVAAVARERDNFLLFLASLRFREG